MHQRLKGTGTSIVRGVLILTLAGILSKMIGTLQKIPLQNIAGDDVFGIFNTVYPLYILVVFLASGGFPISVSKFVSEEMSRGNERDARTILYISIICLSIMGMLFFFVFFLGAGMIAGLMSVPQAKPAIRSISFALLFVPITSAVKGYFQGKQEMLPTAASQVGEQIVRVATMLSLIIILTHQGYTAGWIAAGATFGSTTGALAGLLVIGWYWRRESRRGPALQISGIKILSYLHLIKRFILFAIPVSIGSIIFPLLTLVDSFTVPRLLLHQGLSSTEALTQFGIYNRGGAIVQLVIMMASSLSVALVPVIAEAKARRDEARIRQITALSIRLTWMLGLAASCGLALSAHAVNIMLFRNETGTGTIAILAFTGVFSTLQMLSIGILQGLGSVWAPIRHLLIAAVIKVVLNIILIPLWGINGTALSSVAIFAIAALLNLRTLRKLTQTRYSGMFFKPIAAAATMCIYLLVVNEVLYLLLVKHSALWTSRGVNTGLSFVLVFGGAVTYVAAAFRIGAVREEDLENIEPVRRRLLPWLIRLKLLPGKR